MNRLAALLLALLSIPNSLAAASAGSEHDGSYRGRVLTERFLHQQAEQRRPAALTEEAAPPRQDAGEIAVIDTSRGVVASPNFFDLQGRTVRFTPAGAGYSGAAEAELGFLSAARTNGIALALDDDDAVRVDLPFDFRFFGRDYRELYVGSDGHLTFDEPDRRTAARSLARAVSGPPRIAPLFVDLDPSQSAARVRVYSLPDRVVFTWDGVPLFTRSGNGRRQIVQAELRPDGVVAFHYLTTDLSSAVVGLFPGNLIGDLEPVDLSAGFTAAGQGGFAELFQSVSELDTFAAGQSFYRNHDDAYDFLILFNSLGLSAGGGAFAFEVNVRNDIVGIGDLLSSAAVFDFGQDFGSPRRLASFVNMGPLSNYPDDPAATIPFIGENNTLSLLGQETGHRWGVYVDFIDPATGLRSSNLLGRQEAHWNFFFDSDASVLEGNDIEDLGTAADPRFTTVGTVSRFNALDQYIMGLRSAEEVPPSFLVEQIAGTFSSRSRAPQTGVRFNGVRKEIPVDLIIAAEGPRRPDHTVAERELRFAFVLLVEEGDEPDPADLAKLNRIRQAWEEFFEEAVDQRATASTALVRMLHLSAWPAAGLPLGGPGTARLSIAEPLETDLLVNLVSASGLVGVPETITIPAGMTSVELALQGLGAGVDIVTARAAQPGFDMVTARLQVAALDQVQLAVIEGDDQPGALGEELPEPVVFRVTDENRLGYSGVIVRFEADNGGAVDVAEATTGPDGEVEVSWTLGPSAGSNRLTASIVGAPTVTATVELDAAAGRPVFSAAGVVSAASFNADPDADDDALGPGGLISIFGRDLAAATATARRFPLPRELAGTVVRINGVPAPLILASPLQLNLQVPFELTGPTATIVIETPAGASPAIELPVALAQPGVFFDGGTGLGAVVYASDGLSPWNRPAVPGEFLQIYATGLGSVRPRAETGEAASSFFLSRHEPPIRVRIVAPGSEPFANGGLIPTFAGLTPGFAGLSQVNVELPAKIPPGQYELYLEVDGRRSNAVLIEIGGPAI